jgi:hypothetical protein
MVRQADDSVDGATTGLEVVGTVVRAGFSGEDGQN